MAHVFGHQRVEGAEHRPEVAHSLQALRHPVLVAIKAGHVQTIGTAHVEGPMPIEVEKSRPVRLRHHRAQVEVLPHEPHEGKRHSVGVGETQIGEAVADGVAPRPRPAILGPEEFGQSGHPLPAALDPRLTGPVGAKERLVRIRPCLHPVSEATGERWRPRLRRQGQEPDEEPPPAPDRHRDEHEPTGRQRPTLESLPSVSDPHVEPPLGGMTPSGAPRSVPPPATNQTREPPHEPELVSPPTRAASGLDARQLR